MQNLKWIFINIYNSITTYYFAQQYKLKSTSINFLEQIKEINKEITDSEQTQENQLKSIENCRRTILNSKKEIEMSNSLIERSLKERQYRIEELINCKNSYNSIQQLIYNISTSKKHFFETHKKFCKLKSETYQRVI